MIKCSRFPDVINYYQSKTEDNFLTEILNSVEFSVGPQEDSRLLKRLVIPNMFNSPLEIFGNVFVFADFWRCNEVKVIDNCDALQMHYMIASECTIACFLINSREVF